MPQACGRMQLRASQRVQNTSAGEAGPAALVGPAGLLTPRQRDGARVGVRTCQVPQEVRRLALRLVRVAPHPQLRRLASFLAAFGDRIGLPVARSTCATEGRDWVMATATRPPREARREAAIWGHGATVAEQRMGEGTTREASRRAGSPDGPLQRCHGESGPALLSRCRCQRPRGGSAGPRFEPPTAPCPARPDGETEARRH